VFAGGATTGPWATSVAKCGPSVPQVTACDTTTMYAETGAARTTVKGMHRGLFGGKSATAAIVARHNAGSVAKNLYAAGVADDYTANGVSDWWLPSSDEILKMQENLNNKGLGGFAYDVYWSSSENFTDDAYFQGFNTGFGSTTQKPTLYNVRPVRAF
jgi:hypothetical protein